MSGDLDLGPTLQTRTQEMTALMERLYPIHRAMTGSGVRETLSILSEVVPLTIHEVPTGTRVLDWTIPKEWRIRDAYVADVNGRRLIDYAESNLHVVGYSQAIHRVVDRQELLDHLHTRPDSPDAIPYRTSPFDETWGFCATDRLRASLTDPSYEVCIDAETFDGSLTYGEVVLPGSEPAEVVVTTHVCHPSLANDNVSGMVVAAHFAASMAGRPRRHGFRFLFGPGTLGAITWLSRNGSILDRIRHGLVLAGVGDRGALTYKQTFGGGATIDRAVAAALRTWDPPGAVERFTPWGYDERQFNSPGYRLPFGRISRTPHGSYAEYHSSLDDLAFVEPASLVDSLEFLLSVADILERDRTPISTVPRGEPQLGRRGLLSRTGGRTSVDDHELARLWVLAMADGDHSLLDMVERSGLPFSPVADAAHELAAGGLLDMVDG